MLTLAYFMVYKDDKQYVHIVHEISPSRNITTVFFNAMLFFPEFELAYDLIIMMCKGCGFFTSFYDVLTNDYT